MRHDWQSVPMPPGIAKRPRDVRGFPITFVTLIQSDGRPDFTTIDGEKILHCVNERVCGMCGEPLDQEGPQIAFIGGPISIKNQNFLDPPMHLTCAEYAMRVCPHIATPTARYSKPKEGEGRELYQGVHPDRPEKFGLYICGGYQVAVFRGQPVFVAGDPHGVLWQEDLPPMVQKET